MSLVAIIDYGMCNLDSVARAVEECGGRPLVTDQAQDIQRATHVILPGVGSFADGMKNIRARSLDQVLRNETIEKQIPLLGICLGMQLLGSAGREGGRTEGLGFVPGEVVRLQPTETDKRIPHIGWNAVNFEHDSVLFDGLPSGKDFYFVHSYHLLCAEPGDVLARTPYCGSFASAIQRDMVFAVQFHPEKSQRAGFQVLRNFLRL